MLGRVQHCRLVCRSRSNHVVESLFLSCQRSTFSTTPPTDGGETRPGQHKTKITDWLWNVRKSVIEEKMGSSKKESEKFSNNSEEIQAISPSVSESNVTYEFSKDASLRDSYLNPWGTVRIGRVIEDLDALAGNIAFKHVSFEQSPASIKSLMLVTASIDRIILTHRANLKDDITLSGKVSWVGSSSMEISMMACSSWTHEPWLSALFTFVARDKTPPGKARRINSLLPETADEIAAFEAGLARATQRKTQRKTKNATELQRKQLEDIIRVESHEEASVTIEEAALALYNRSKPRLLMPAVAMKDAVLISETVLSNTQIMQPQQRNTAGRIFGGFLVRKAYEIAFSTAYLFSGRVPKFSEIDEVIFRKPVDVGDLVHFDSCVLFTSTSLHSNPSVHIEVIAHVVTPENVDSDVSNSFNFTFEFPGQSIALAQVVPETQEQAYKIVTRYYGDLVQKFEDEHNKK